MQIYNGNAAKEIQNLKDNWHQILSRLLYILDYQYNTFPNFRTQYFIAVDYHE